MSNYLFRMFGKSPISPIQQHMAKVYECASQLTPFFAAVIAKDLDTMVTVQQQIVTLEHEADKLKKEIRLNLPSDLLLPVSRRDLLDTLRTQDMIANKTKDIAGLMLGRKMQMPKAISKLFVKYVNRSIDATHQAKKAIDELEELLETGFRGQEVKLVKKLIKTLNRIENDTDVIQIEIRGMLFEIEKDMPPIDVMFLYKIIDGVGDLADLAQKVGSRLQLMLAK